MATGTISPDSFVWLIPRWRESFQHSGNGIKSPHFHLLDSSWILVGVLYGGKVMICLHNYSGAPKTVTYSIKLYLNTDVKEINGTRHFDSTHKFGREILEICKHDVESYTNLLITCNINCDTPHQVAGKDIMTCAVQTEVANTVIEKENPRNEEFSSLDIKGVTLLSESMKNLLIKGIDHDLTICVQDKEFRAHRNILSARSPVFAMMLSHDTKENITGTINIEDCDPESFDEFLLYVYSGRTENLTPSNALQLYYPADKYDFPVLKERCVSLLKTSLSVESICDVVLLAAIHQEKELLEVATDFFAQNLEEILVSVSWLNFMSQNPVKANELYIKSMKILLLRK